MVTRQPARRRGAIGALFGPRPAALAPELSLEVLGVGADPERALRAFGPDARWREITERLADARARLCQQKVGPALPLAGSEDARHLGGIGALTLALFRAFAGQPGELSLHLFLANRNLGGLRSLGRFVPLGQGREQPALGAFGLGHVRAQHLRPRPARPGERLERAPRPVSLGPVVAPANRKHRTQRLTKESRRRSVGLGRIDIERGGQPLGRGHAEPRGVQKGVEFEQVEPGKVGIAQPRGDQRRVEHQHRRIGTGIDRLPLADLLCRPVGRAQPQPGMAGVECGQSGNFGDRRGHRATMSGVRNEK